MRQRYKVVFGFIGSFVLLFLLAVLFGAILAVGTIGLDYLGVIQLEDSRAFDKPENISIIEDVGSNKGEIMSVNESIYNEIRNEGWLDKGYFKEDDESGLTEEEQIAIDRDGIFYFGKKTNELNKGENNGNR